MTLGDEEQFVRLAIKVLAKSANPQELQEFQSLLAQSAEHRDRFEQLKGDLIIAKDVLSLLAASDATGAGLTDEQLGNLKTQVAANITRPRRRRRICITLMVCLVSGLMVLLATNPALKEWLGKRLGSPSPPEPVVEIAWVDVRTFPLEGNKREDELKDIRQVFRKNEPKVFTSQSELDVWMGNWPSTTVPCFKIIVIHQGLKRTAHSVQFHGKLPKETRNWERVVHDPDSTFFYILQKAKLEIGGTAKRK